MDNPTPVAIIGLGRVGRAFLDLCPHVALTVDPVAPGADIPSLDAVDPAIAKIAVVTTPGTAAPAIIRQCFALGWHVLDVSFHDGDPMILGAEAKDAGVWYVPDAGFGPGIMNALIRRTQMAVETPGTTVAYVGGLPLEARPPWNYISTWNTADHLAEYTRPARYIDDGELRSQDPLEAGTFEIETAIGTLEAFMSDGLRGLLVNPGAPNVTEYTLRWPGFLDKMQKAKNGGWLSKGRLAEFIDHIETSGVWEFKPDDLDLSVLIVTTTDVKNGQQATMSMLHTRYPGLEHSSMSYCTAAGALAALTALATTDETGLITTETLVEDDGAWEVYRAILADLGINIQEGPI